MENSDYRYRIHQEMLDSFDEELELEIDDERLGGADESDEKRATRQKYFRELLRVQGELVKLQDWVVATKQKGNISSDTARNMVKLLLSPMM